MKMLSRKIFLYLVIILSVISSAVHSQESSETLVSDRPFVSQSPRIVSAGSYQIESGYGRVNIKSGLLDVTTISFPELLIRIGGDNLELRFATNVLKQSVSFDTLGSFSDYSFSDLYFGAKVRLTNKLASKSNFALEIGITLPSGSEVVYFGFVTNFLYRVPITAQTFISGSSGFSVPNYRVSAFIFSQALVFNLGLSDRMSLFTEPFFVADNINSGNSSNLVTNYFLNSGLKFMGSNKLEFDFYFGKNFNISEANYFTGFGLTFRPK